MIDKIDEKNQKVDTEELNNICDECKEEDESVTQNLILTGFKSVSYTHLTLPTIYSV